DRWQGEAVPRRARRERRRRGPLGTPRPPGGVPARAPPLPGEAVTARAGLALAALATALGCSHAANDTRIDLSAYLARTKVWAPAEAETARTIVRIFDTQFVDEPEIHRQIDDSRPRVLAHVAQLREYHPRSAEVQHVHSQYLDAWQKLLDGYDAIEKGFATGEYTNLARGRKDLEDWRDTMVAVAEELRGLMEHFGVDANGTVESRAWPPGHAATQST